METIFLPNAYFQGKLIPFGEAKLSVATHALQYGTGAYGGIRGVVNPQNSEEALLFRLDDHVKRLVQSARIIHYKIEADVVRQAILDVVRTGRPQRDFYIRPFVYDSSLNFSPSLSSGQRDFLVYGFEFGDYLPADGIACCFSSWQRQTDVSMPLRSKLSGSYITSCLAKTEAIDRGFDEALLINSNGKVCEGSAMNLFMVKDGVLVTPGADQDILEGITRKSVLQIAKDMQIPVVERSIDKSELVLAEEVFLTGTGARIVPVSKIENYILSEDKPVGRSIQQKFREISEGRVEEYKDWLTSVNYL